MLLNFSVLFLCVSFGTAAYGLYLTNQSASRGPCWTFNFSLSKYNLTCHNLEHRKLEMLNF